MQSTVISISGGRVKHAINHAKVEFQDRYPVSDDRFHHHVYAVLGELVYNAAQHGAGNTLEGSWSVGSDADGTFVEVTSISAMDKAEYVIDFIERNKRKSDVMIFACEQEVLDENLRLGKSGGMGLYQVIRSALPSYDGKLISAESRSCDLDGFVELSIRVHVSTYKGDESLAG